VHRRKISDAAHAGERPRKERTISAHGIEQERKSKLS
jgi:hypothetical protein